MKTIEYASYLQEQLTTIVTYVFCDHFKYTDLLKFSRIINSFKGRVLLKINNLIPNHRNADKARIDDGILKLAAERLVAENPYWKGKVILINEKDAISNIDAIQHV
ncbi:hypothetical protein TI03_02055 [Achromatium sp. WMS1]|nr:hypothetical protein TI03_02055 [Achromatium sp. WMS1]